MPKRRKSPVTVETTEPHMCSRELRLEILRTVPFFQSFKDQEMENVNRLFSEKGFSTGEYIYYSGDASESFYVIAQGRVRLLHHAVAGKEIMLDLLIPGDFFGAFVQTGENEYAETAQAVTDTCILTISIQQFDRVINEYPSVAVQMLKDVGKRLQEAHETIRLLSAESAEKRIAHILLKLAGKLGEIHEVGLLIQTPLGREELAEMTGTTPETASRVMSQFQKEGWIETGRQWIAITDPNAIQAVVEH